MSKFISSPADVPKHQKVNLKDADISDNIHKKFEKLCEDFVDIFSTGQSDIGHTKLIEMDIDTGNSPPVCQKLYTLPLKHNQWVKEELEALEKAGIILQSMSPWSSPIVFVPKRSAPGEPPQKHLCVDY